MNIIFRIVLVVTSVVSLGFVLWRIRKSQTQINDAIFWIAFMLALVVISVFPGIAIYISNLLGIVSPANFTFLCIIAGLLIKVFTMSLQMSKMQYQIQRMVQTIALENKQKDSDDGRSGKG